MNPPARVGTTSSRRSKKLSTATNAAATTASSNKSSPSHLVPPKAKRRIKQRERRNAKARQRQTLVIVGLIFILAVFMGFNVLYLRRLDQRQGNQEMKQQPSPNNQGDVIDATISGRFPNELEDQHNNESNGAKPITKKNPTTTTRKNVARPPPQQPQFPRWKNNPGHQKPPPPQMTPPKKKKKRTNLRHGGVDGDDGNSNDGHTNKWITDQSQPFNWDHKASTTHHLIMVAGHSVTISGHLGDAGIDEKDWYLLDYQRGHGLPEAIVAHIKAGINEAIKDPDSLLIFSGGETRPITGPLSEGSSYFHVADAMNLWDQQSVDGNSHLVDVRDPSNTVRARTVTEEFATDSFENLLFSICRFKEITGHYPTKITTVSFTFKRRRFETLHAPALRWPSNQFIYVGIDPPASTGFDIDTSTKGELENAARPFESDPYGCNSDILQQKRRDRNPYSRTPPYPLSCPEMSELLKYCGPELFPSDKLPWG